MATNTPAKHPNVIRFTVGAAAEAPFSFEGVTTVIGYKIQSVDQTDIYVSLDPGGTFSPDNYWTIKSASVFEETDINWTPPEEALYFRSASGEITVEVWYWG